MKTTKIEGGPTPREMTAVLAPVCPVLSVILVMKITHHVCQRIPQFYMMKMEIGGTSEGIQHPARVQVSGI